MITVNDWLKSSSLKLKNISSSPFSDSELLLMSVLKISKEKIITQPSLRIVAKDHNKLNALLTQRQKGLPMAYLLKTKAFYGLDFFVNKNVLIPRSDSEMIVEYGKEIIEQIHKPTIVELGIGSGALLISLIKNYQELVTAYGLDISPLALTVAKKNLVLQHLNKKITLKKSDLLVNWPKDKQIDLLIANLPYLPNDYLKKHKSKAEISLKFEPKISLFSGHDGLDLYRRLNQQLAKYKINTLIIECLPQQIKKLIKIFTNDTYACEAKTDLGGTPRFIVVNKKQ